MKFLKFILASFSSIAALAVGLSASTPRSFPTAWESADCHVVVSGTSTLHDWSVESRTASGEIRFLDGVARGRLSIPAKSLSGAQKGLNERMHAALKADAHAAIVFEALDLALPNEGLRRGGAQTISVRGQLSVAGGSEERAFACSWTITDDGLLLIETVAELKMTAFGVKPPTFMGMVRTGNVISVRVRWTLKPVGTATSAHDAAAFR